MATTLKFNTAQDTLEAATKLLETTFAAKEINNELPTFLEWWKGILYTHRNKLRITTLHAVTSVRFNDYKEIISPLLNNPSVETSDIWVGVGKSGLVEARISISQIRRLAVKKGICKP